MRPVKYKVWDKDEKVMHQPDEICRINFQDGVPYGILFWDGQIILRNFELLAYIGKNDTKKKEIYVGDKVKWFGHEVKEGKQIRPERIFIVTDDIYDLYRITNIVLSGTASPEIIGNIYEDSG